MVEFIRLNVQWVSSREGKKEMLKQSDKNNTIEKHWNGVARKELTPLMIPTVTSADDTLGMPLGAFLDVHL